MVDTTRKESHWWWFEGHKNMKRSLWLQSTIEELDAKTKAMLRIIEEDAESFAQRAEMLYKKKPELISMVEDFYRAHRSLAERYDLLKAEHVTPTPMASPHASCKSKSEKMTTMADLCYDTYSISSISEDFNDSEIEEAERASNGEKDVIAKEGNEESERLRDEIEKLKEENRVHKLELLQKDEDKREVIRQLSVAIDMLKAENANLRRMVALTTINPCFSRQSKPTSLNEF